MLASSDPSCRLVLPEDSPLLANMAALWGADPAFARHLEAVLDSDPYPVEPSKSGPPTVALCAPDGRRLYLHSRHQPMDEANRLVQSGELDEKPVICIHGFGLGYHVESLFDQVSDETVLLVLESDLRLIRTAFEHRDFSRQLRTGRLLFMSSCERSELLLRLGNRQAQVCIGLGFLVHPPSQQIHESFHRQARVVIDEFEAFCRTSLNTLILNGRRTCENIARNIGWYVSRPGISDLRHRHAKQPAIIVSAGPSLRKNKQLLKDAVGRAVIIAVQTTLQPLLEMGIEPDYVTSLDYHDICTRFYEKLPKNLRTQLVAEPKASPAIFSLYPGPVRLLGNEFADGLVREMKLQKDRLRAGATVAHLAFYLAEYMGCDPIIFVGQDLGFSDGLCYTPGTSYEDVWRPELNRFCTVEMKQWEHIARERPILRKIQDHQGRPMYTEERLFSYLQQFERDFATTSARIIDATEGGAFKRGAAPMPLADALHRFCALARPETGDSRPESTCDESRHALECLVHRKSESAQIEQVARDTLPLLQETRDHLDDQIRVNRLIARIDALRAKMNTLNDTYELATQLCQQTELSRFRSDLLLASSKASGADRQRRQLDRDIANVQGIIDAAAQFQKLMDDVMGHIRATPARKHREATA